jgi:hypothetical protein
MHCLRPMTLSLPPPAMAAIAPHQMFCPAIVRCEHGEGAAGSYAGSHLANVSMPPEATGPVQVSV